MVAILGGLLRRYGRVTLLCFDTATSSYVTVLGRGGLVTDAAEKRAHWKAVSLGFAVALAAGAGSLFAEREGGAMALRRGFVLSPGERTLVVEDVVTTGASAREVYELVREAGAEVLGVAALIDRSTEAVGFPLRAILRVQARTWDPVECPMCLRGDPVQAPGSGLLRPAATASGPEPGEAEPSSRG